jgi:hypothetical protein
MIIDQILREGHDKATDEINIVLKELLTQCFELHLKKLFDFRDEHLGLIDMCIDKLLELEVDPIEIFKIIYDISKNFFPTKYYVIMLYIERLLPGFIKYKQI